MTNSLIPAEYLRNQALGKCQEILKTENGIVMQATNAVVEVAILSSRTLNVHIRRSEEKDINPYSVIQKPSVAGFEMTEEENEIKLVTEMVVLEIQKSPIRFTFKTTNGHVINQDDDQFGTSFNQTQSTTYKKLQEGERFIGLGEKTGPLDRRGQGYENWNTDQFAYGPDTDPLYCSMPFYIGLHHEMAYGIYLDNSYKSHFNFGASNDRFSSFSADGGDMNYYFIYDHSVAGIIEAYSQLTGFMPLPPIWSIGYQQCRYSYYPDDEVKRIAKTFRDKDIAADVIVLDIHYMEQYKIFTWDNIKFSDPKELINYLKELGFHVVVMCDPGIKIEEGYSTYEDGLQQNVYLKYPDGTNYSGSVWPGLCHFPDFTKESTRNWWEDQFKKYTELGIDGFWNDMNEIATWGQMLPEHIEFDFDGSPATTRKGRNIYGFQMSRATYEGSKNSLNGKRPFNLTRSAFSGVQRYATVWTGDNVATDEHMMVGVRLVNSLGLTGVAYAGYDIGGFIGNASENLFTRWVQVGAFSPFFRGHSMINSKASEPWSYGEQAEEISRNFIKLRYKLMGYLYSLFYEASQTGMPVSRSLAIDYSHDPLIYDGKYQNQYLFGPSILVAPLESDKELSKVYLPEGEWFELFTDEHYGGNTEIIADCGIQRLPVYVKGSSILPVLPKANTNTKNLGDTLEVHVYAGKESNSFVYYEDDGESFDYESGSFYKRSIDFNPDRKEIKLNEVEGDFTSRFSHLAICFHGFEDISNFTLNKIESPSETHSYRFIDPIANFDPFGNDTGEWLKINNIQSVKTHLTNSEITISWS